MPFSPNARHVRGAAGERSFAGSVAWYRTTVIVPRAGVYAIRFESVNHKAAVWVDGHFAARHTGTYLPFEARVRLTGGAHTLVVRADWRDPAAMKADAWHRTWFNFGGINRPVSIRELGASELVSPSIVTHLDGTDRGGRPRGRSQQPRRPADHRRARDAGRHRGALRSRPARSRRARHRARARAHPAPGALGARPPDARGPAPRGPRRGGLHRARRPARGALGRAGAWSSTARR